MDVTAKFEEQTHLLNVLAAQYGTTADAVVSSMKTISDGTLSMVDATKLATQGLFKGLDPTQLDQITSSAMILKTVMGTDLVTAEEKLINAVTRGRAAASARLVGIMDLDAALGKAKENDDQK